MITVNLLLLCSFIAFCEFVGASTLRPSPVFSSCTSRGVTKWNRDPKLISLELESWLQGMVSVPERSAGLHDNVSSLLFDPENDKFRKHWFWVNDISESEYIDDSDRSVRTIGKFNIGIDGVTSRGISWQWLAKRKLEGMLYGQMDSEGRFTGEDIIFIYPDMLTGIQGHFRNGELVSGSAVDITGERCHQGLKEIEVRPAQYDPHVIWRKEKKTEEVWPPHVLGQHPTVMDPMERKNVYVGASTQPFADEGLFARRNFRAGDVVSYFSGQRTLSGLMFHDNMTSEVTAEVGSYYFNLGDNCAQWWGCRIEDFVIDVPIEFRSITKFRRTLGHKGNHKFKVNNVDYETVLHPVHGPIACLIANRFIRKGQEIFSDYNYELENAEKWYVDQYNKAYKNNSGARTKQSLGRLIFS